eukprot:CAMPEP_0184743524 /NCGR_PEP_ID=MMETSP0315-20130426/6419_1 /TAXON_ID=101924 /ORGANISM="Rhodosorus marinus, Strain UTEX LB 2760" /LENGTH=92 /DNA_ID=CAMNT_0027214879 /DNA_START=545 /DNA_END=820 /DNA_ORIENTATION=-
MPRTPNLQTSPRRDENVLSLFLDRLRGGFSLGAQIYTPSIPKEGIPVLLPFPRTDLQCRAATRRQIVKLQPVRYEASFYVHNHLGDRIPVSS